MALAFALALAMAVVTTPAVLSGAIGVYLIGGADSTRTTPHAGD